MAEASGHPRMAADDRRRQLIEVSIDLFAKKGFAGTTTKEIAAAAGVTEAIIFRHFATKQDLYSAIVSQMFSRAETEDWIREMQVLMDRNDDEGVVRLLIGSLLKFSRTNPKYERLMMYAALEGNELAVMHQNDIAKPIGERLHNYVTRRQEAGAWVRCDPELILCAMLGAIKFYASKRYMFGCGGEVDDERAVGDLVGIVLNGIRGGRE